MRSNLWNNDIHEERREEIDQYDTYPLLDPIGTWPKAELTDEDLTFGSYMPSATSSRPSSRRSVRFEDDNPLGMDSDRPASRAASAPPTGTAH